MVSKMCTKCDRYLAMDRFSPHSTASDGHQTQCKSCLNGTPYDLDAHALLAIVEMQGYECAFCERPISFEVNPRQDFTLDHNHALERQYFADFRNRNDGAEPNRDQKRAIMKRTLRGLLCVTCNTHILTTPVIDMLEDEEKLEKALLYRDLLCYPPDQEFIDEYGSGV